MSVTHRLAGRFNLDEYAAPEELVIPRFLFYKDSAPDGAMHR